MTPDFVLNKNSTVYRPSWAQSIYHQKPPTHTHKEIKHVLCLCAVHATVRVPLLSGTRVRVRAVLGLLEFREAPREGGQRAEEGDGPTALVRQHPQCAMCGSLR